MTKKLHGPPSWLFGDDLPGRILALRRAAPGRTALDRGTGAIAAKLGINRSTLSGQISRIRRCAEGGGRVDREPDRKTAALFIATFDRIGPTQAEINGELKGSRRRTPAQAASSLERMQRLTRDVERIAGVAG